MSPESEGTDLSQPAGGESRGKSAERSLAELRAKYPDTRERTTLKVWHYHAIAMKEIYGYTWAEVGEIFQKSESYLSSLACSPAGKEFRERIRSMEPPEIAEVTLQAASVGATQDFMAALEWAKQARDYKAVHQMTRDLLDFADVGKKKGADGSGGQTIHIHLDSKDLDSPEVETSYEVLEAELLDPEDD